MGLQQPLLQSHLQSLSKHRYVVVKNWLDDVQIDELQRDAVAVDAFGASFEAAIGDATFSQARLDRDVRNSRTIQLYPPPSNAAGNEATRARLTRAVNDLRDQLQASTTLQLPHLAPFQTQMSYLLYPCGASMYGAYAHTSCVCVYFIAPCIFICVVSVGLEHRMCA